MASLSLKRPLPSDASSPPKFKSALSGDGLLVPLGDEAAFIPARPEGTSLRVSMAWALWCIAIAKFLLELVGEHDLSGKITSGNIAPDDVIMAVLTVAHVSKGEFGSRASASELAKAMRAFDKYVLANDDKYGTLMDFVRGRTSSSSNHEARTAAYVFMKRFIKDDPDKFPLRYVVGPFEDMVPAHILAQIFLILGYSEQLAGMVSAISQDQRIRFYYDIIEAHVDPCGSSFRKGGVIPPSNEQYAKAVRCVIDRIDQFAADPSDNTVKEIIEQVHCAYGIVH